jgi:endonuclease/exonuclease/phosphatase (EEP) superfamily protein YafD
LNILTFVLTGIALLAIGTTLLPIIPLPLWWIRVWDFPRVQLAALLAGSLLGFLLLRPYGNLADWGFIASLAIAFVWQMSWVGPYFRGAPRQMESCTTGENTENAITLLTTNVLQSNRAIDRMVETVLAADPDVFFGVEVDEWWTGKLAQALRDRYPHQLLYPLSNEYGLALFSRLALVEPEVRFVFDDAIPSIRTGVRLRSGAIVSLYGVHPRPPSIQQDSTERDIELLRVAMEIRKRAGPAIVLGDLNDVAWSRTTSQFTRTGELLDPRRGRGFYNTYPARWRGFRYPLDYIFATGHFRIGRMQVLPEMGSDHLPLLAEFTLSNQAPLSWAGSQPA